ncbi:MAG: hypothetical protein AAF928_19550 [Myxococcota bacterium]
MDLLDGAKPDAAKRDPSKPAGLVVGLMLHGALGCGPEDARLSVLVTSAIVEVSEEAVPAPWMEGALTVQLSAPRLAGHDAHLHYLGMGTLDTLDPVSWVTVDPPGPWRLGSEPSEPISIRWGHRSEETRYVRTTAQFFVDDVGVFTHLNDYEGEDIPEFGPSGPDACTTDGVPPDELSPAWVAPLTGEGRADVDDVFVDDAGEIAFVGTRARGELRLGPTTLPPLDTTGEGPFLGVLDAQGGPRWLVALDVQDVWDTAAVVRDAAGNVYATINQWDADAAGDPRSVRLVRFGADGEAHWERTFEDASGVKRVLVAAPDGGVVTLLRCGETGCRFGEPGPSPTGRPREAAVVRVDGEGALSSVRRVGGEGLEIDARGLIVNGDGSVVVAGNLDGRAPTALEFEAGAPVAWSGEPVFVARLGATGDAEWVRLVPGSGRHEARALERRDHGDIVLAGRLGGTLDFGGATALVNPGASPGAFVVEFSARGTLLRERIIPGFSDVVDLAVGPEQGLNLVGSFRRRLTAPGGPSLGSAGDEDIVRLEYGRDGTFRRVQRVGGRSEDLAGAIGRNASGMMVVAARSPGCVDFGDGRREAQGLRDAYIVRYR